MATENIDIRIREDGSRVVRRNIDDIGSSAERSAGGVDMLKKALGALGTVLAVNKLRQYADTWTDLNSRVKLATGSQEAATAVMGRLTTMARRTYSSLEQTAEGYLANATALKEMGLSTERSLDYVEALNNALVVSGAKSERAASVSDSLSKAMMLGKLSGQNLNTVISSGGRIAELLAEQLGVTTSELLALGQQGKITGEVIQSALIDNLELLREEADSMPATIGDAFILLENGLIAAIGKFDEMTGASSKVADLLIELADNMELVTAALLSIGAAVAVAFAPGLIVQFAAAIKSLWVLLAANPFIALAGAISAAVTFVALYGDEMNAGIDATTSLKDVMRAFVEEAVELWDWLTGVVTEFFTGQEQLAADAANGVTAITEDATSTWMDSYSTFYDDVGEGFAGVLRGIARTVDAITGLLLGLGVTIGRTFGGLPDVFREIFARVYNTVVDKIEALVNATIRGMNRLRSIVGKDPIELINLERKDVNERAFAEYGEHIGKSFDDAFGAMMEGGFEARLNNVFDRAQRISQDRLSKMTSEADLSGDGGAGRRGTGADNDAAEKQRKELERLEQQFKSLLSSLDPIRAAQLSMAEAQDTLNKALAAGIINTAEHALYSDKLAESYKDALDPLGKLNRELEEQARLLGMNARERELEAQLLAHTQQLQQAGITLTEQETAVLRDKLRALQDLNAVVQEQDTLLANSVGKRQQFTDQLQAIQNLLADTNSGFSKADATEALAGMYPDLFEGTQEFLDMQVERHAQMYNQIDELRQADLISEQTANQMKAKLDAELNQQRLSTASSFFGNLAVLSKSKNRELAAIGKAAAITQATIDGVLAVQKALASAPPPANYALAASVGIATAANVAQIAGIGFMTGGQFTVGGSGGADSQMVAFRATPGEQVAISTPTQVKKGDPNRGGQQQEAPQVNQRIVNIIDPDLMGDYLSTPEGEQLLVNTIRRNSDSVRQAISG
jgi:tape measure domain-containing protein